MDKKYELLKVKYEDARTWLLAFLAIVVSLSLGIYKIEDIPFKRNLSQLSFLLVFVIIFFAGLQLTRYIKVIRYLKGKK